MRINCHHGYFKLWAEDEDDISQFISTYGFDIESQDDYFTFSTLVDAPKYSIAGNLYLGALAIKTFEGEPWEVMRENGLVYDFNLDQVLPIALVIQLIQLKETNRYFISNGLIIAGSLTDAGERVTDYAAFYNTPGKFKYTEVNFE